MPRTARADQGGICHHVLNRGNARRQIFFKDGDYQAFLKALGNAHREVPVALLAYCLGLGDGKRVGSPDTFSSLSSLSSLFFFPKLRQVLGER
jgi:hypothetical protein